MQGLVVRGLWNVNVNCVSHCSMKYRSRSPGQGICRVSTLRSTARLMVVGLLVEIERRRKMCQSHWSAKYRSRSLGQGTCLVSTTRRSTVQGLVVIGLGVEKIWNVDVNCVKITGARNIGHGHRVKHLPSREVREMCHKVCS